MRIIYVIDSLASKGGAERILTDKMNYMARQWGWEVHVITCYQDAASSPNVYELSERVRQTNLQIPYHSQYRYGYPRRLMVKWRIYRTLCRRLSATVRQIDPDVLIGLGYFQADVVTAIRCRAMKVVESHEARIFTMGDQGLSRSWLSRLYMRYYKKRYFRAVERQADVVVTLTEGDAMEWRKARRVEVIPNFTVMQESARQQSSERLRVGTSAGMASPAACRRVIAVGRLEWQKGFDRLIDAWAMIASDHLQWRLDIFGSGTMEAALNARIAQLTANGQPPIAIHPFTKTIADEYAASSIFALSSRFEGFGLVLLEAMQHGVPCVVFDCPFGPSDVVVDGECGFVVPDGDIRAFADRLAQLMDDEPLRCRFAAAAKERVKLFSVDKVMGQWKELLTIDH